jgi:hypothetical protein
MDERKRTIQKIIRLIITELEEPDKGNLTATYAIGILREAIADIETKALMSPVRYSLKDES